MHVSVHELNIAKEQELLQEGFRIYRVASKVSSLRFAVGWDAFLNRSAGEGR
jgi:hypothetical protein